MSITFPAIVIDKGSAVYRGHPGGVRLHVRDAASVEWFVTEPREDRHTSAGRNDRLDEVCDDAEVSPVPDAMKATWFKP